MNEALIIGGFIAAVIVFSALAIHILRDRTDYVGMARSLRRMRDETRAYGGDFKPIASLAKEMLKK